MALQQTKEVETADVNDDDPSVTVLQEAAAAVALADANNDDTTATVLQEAAAVVVSSVLQEAATSSSSSTGVDDADPFVTVLQEAVASNIIGRRKQRRYKRDCSSSNFCTNNQ